MKLAAFLVVVAYLAGVATPIVGGYLAIRNMERPITRAKKQAVEDYSEHAESRGPVHSIRGARPACP